MKTVKVVLTMLALCAASAFAGGDYEAVVDDSVIGYWRFNDPNDYGKDSSGHGSGIVQWNNNASGDVVSVSTDWSRGGGCLELPRDGKVTTSSPYTYGTAVATVTSGDGFDLDREEPGWTIATWIRGSSDLVKSIPNASLASGGDAGVFKTALGDGNWHPMVIVYRPTRSENKDFYRVYLNAFDGEKVTVLTSGGTDKKGEPAWHIPLNVTSGANPYDTVTLGGTIGGVVKFLGTHTVEGTFFGGLDDCAIIDRELEGGEQDATGEHEVFRFVKTGETFVFSKGSTGTMFYDAGNWSNGEAPKAGLAYMVENGHNVKSEKTATFAGKSLSIGRTEKLYGIKSVGGAKEVIVDNTVGKLTQKGTSTTLTINDLVLNDGILTSREKNQTLTGNIRVRASAANPFKIAVSNDYTYTVTGTMKDDGSIVKVGSGALNLAGLTESTAKVSLSEGSLVLPVVNPTLSGYDGGTLLVEFDESAGTATTVTIDASWSGTLMFRLRGGKPSKAGRYAAIVVPTTVKTVTAADFDNQTTCADGFTIRTKILTENSRQTVYVECIPTDDAKGSPVLGFE